LYARHERIHIGKKSYVRVPLVDCKKKRYPQVVTAKNYEDLRRTLEGTVEPIITISGPIAQEKELPLGIGIPVIGLNSNGEEIIRPVKGLVRSR